MSRRITVCANCLQASCWQAVFMCEQAQTANITTRTENELAVLGREHADYWLTDVELARGVKPGQQIREGHPRGGEAAAPIPTKEDPRDR